MPVTALCERLAQNNDSARDSAAPFSMEANRRSAVPGLWAQRLERRHTAFRAFMRPLTQVPEGVSQSAVAAIVHVMRG